MKRFPTRSTTASLAFFLAIGGASAADLGLANQFNGFLFGNAVTSGGHSDGAMAVGGSWSGSGYDALQSSLAATVGSLTNVGMYVGGSVNFTASGSVNNSGNAYVNGDFHGNTFNMNGGTLYYGGSVSGVNGSKVNQANTVSASTFADQYAYSVLQSNYLASLGGEAINTADPNNWSVNAANQSGSLKLYTISASDLNKLRTLNFSNLGSGDTAVINVLGATVVGFGITVNTNTGSYSHLLWNFSTAGSIAIDQRALHGSILAPNADVTQSQNIDGNLIADNLTVLGSVELHNGIQAKFGGDIPVPEPATILVALAGLAGIAFRRRR
ncbi:MAG TPA: collagen-binding domain-containing protein [Fimbriimonadaceae bacterium]|nr:collagen-binding domain-containing protein [Fimbriimonadaceae bacterium]